MLDEPVGEARPAGSAAGIDPAGVDDVVAHIADQVRTLETLDSRPLAEHAPAYLHVHGQLQAALAEIDSA